MHLLNVLVRKFRTAARLPLERRWRIARAWWALMWVQFSLDVLPYRYWQRRLSAATHTCHDGTPTPVAQKECGLIAQDIAIAARNHLLRVNCLGRSLVLHALCHRAGFSTQIAIGVRKNHGDIEGHAWLEADGVVLNDTIEHVNSFTKLHRVPSFRPTFMT